VLALGERQPHGGHAEARIGSDSVEHVEVRIRQPESPARPAIDIHQSARLRLLNVRKAATHGGYQRGIVDLLATNRGGEQFHR